MTVASVADNKINNLGEFSVIIINLYQLRVGWKFGTAEKNSLVEP